MRDVLWGKGRVSEDGKISHLDYRETGMLCTVIGTVRGRAGTWGTGWCLAFGAAMAFERFF